MIGTLLTYAPLIACPLGMAAMMGIPAFMYRAKRRRQVTDPNGRQRAIDLDGPPRVGAGLSAELTVARTAHDAEPPRDVLGSVQGNR